MIVMNFDKHTVKQAAAGRWAEIFSALAPQLKLAQAHPGKHCPCPVHGGTDGFRLFPGYEERGNGICNTCGAKSDGFQMLMWIHEWSFPETIEKVGRYLGLQPEASQITPISTESTRHEEAPTDVYEGEVIFIGKKNLRRSNGTPATVFTIKVKDEAGRVSTCMGTDLNRASTEVKLRKGHAARITRLGVREVTLPNGQKVNKTLWNIERLEKADVPKHVLSAPVEPQKHDKRQTAIDHLWDAARPLLAPEDTQSTPVEQYLLNRSIDVLSLPSMPDTIRFIPSAFYRNEETGKTESYPAMLTAVRDLGGRLVTVHRTFLTEDGWKAPVTTPKRLMALPEGSTISGAAIQFGEPEDVLCIAEGVETALSVLLGTGYPCWAAISANGMTEVLIPQKVKTVLIFADKDRTETGEMAAEKLRARLALEGKLAVIIQIADAIPEGSKGLDWNDILRTKGAAAFPVRNSIAASSIP